MFKKKFNSVFQDYRAPVLPNVIENWDAMNENIQSNLIKVDDFFEASSKAWDRLLSFDRPVGSLANGWYSKGESGTLWLIRTTCKAVQTHGCEESGRISHFHTFLREEFGFYIVPFVPFKGNQFNVLFYNGGIL